MDAVKFIKESKRLCKAQESCGKCVAQIGACCLTDICVEENSAEKAVAVVEQWSKDHPVKTRQSEFLKMFPHANINGFTDTFCVAHFDKTKICKASASTDEMCEKCRDDYWNEEVSE